MHPKTIPKRTVFDERWPDGAGANRLKPVHFIKLVLTDKSGQVASQNIYWHATPVEQDKSAPKAPGDVFENYLALNDMKPVALKGSFSNQDAGGTSTLTIQLENPTSQIALMAAVKVVRADAPTERVLPIHYDDNYVTLLPHEKREIHAEFESALLKGSQPSVLLNGSNVPASKL